MSIHIVVDVGKPEGDFTATTLFERRNDGSIHILGIQFMTPKHGYNMPDGVFTSDIPGFFDDEDDRDSIEDACSRYSPGMDGVCLFCGEPLSKHDDQEIE